MGMGGPRSPPRGGGFGPRFDDRGPPPMNGHGPSPGRDGPPNMFSPRGRSRSPNRPPSGDMMRKRDRSWERGGPPPDMMRRPFNGPNGPLPDSPRMMEPRPFDFSYMDLLRIVQAAVSGCGDAATPEPLGRVPATGPAKRKKGRVRAQAGVDRGRERLRGVP
ncbi:hypothetical protein ON010_g14808 [Phytophthora cinnamomi]|nr:hypothetical protein ON010_g14808 [Phytophthora cinnamomi]